MINAFITVTPESALQAAKKADERRTQGESHALLGVPYALKDVFSTQGIRTTAGSRILEDYIPPYSATIYEALDAVGAVLIGKTNCDAFGHGSSTENSDFGTTRNPWDTTKVAGGSSGGSAAAVAYGAGLFSIAEDTGGSIRQPAAFCSVAGLKPTWGVVSRHGCIAYASSLDTVGPMARTVEDIGTVMNVIAQRDPRDASQSKAASYRRTYDLRSGKGKNRRYRIGLPKEFHKKGNEVEVQQTLQAAVRQLEKLGHEVLEVSLPSTEYAIECYYLLAVSEASSNLARYDGIRFGKPRQHFNAENKRRIMLGTFALSSGYVDQYYLKALKVRTKIYRDFQMCFRKHGVDALVAPVSPTLPFGIGEKVDDPIQMYLADIYTVPINVAGVPSLALPCGFSKRGMPIGMQLIGDHYTEMQLLELGHQYQQETDWHTRRPPL